VQDRVGQPAEVIDWIPLGLSQRYKDGLILGSTVILFELESLEITDLAGLSVGRKGQFEKLGQQIEQSQPTLSWARQYSWVKKMLPAYYLAPLNVGANNCENPGFNPSILRRSGV
jgi:hypothetical protein